MKRNREFWTRHVKGWRASGLTQAQYCRRHRLLKGTLGYWASTLNKVEGERLGVGGGRARRGPGPGATLTNRVHGGAPIPVAAVAGHGAGSPAGRAVGAGASLMIGLEVKEARVFVRPGATDMRKQINGLVVIIEQEMEANVFESVGIKGR